MNIIRQRIRPFSFYGNGVTFKTSSAILASDMLGYFETSSVPVYVSGISISGVDKHMIRDRWTDCISQDGNHYRDGKGYMMHAMTILQDKQNVECEGNPYYDIRETSCDFNWPDYPSPRGVDW